MNCDCAGSESASTDGEFTELCNSLELVFGQVCDFNSLTNEICVCSKLGSNRCQTTLLQRISFSLIL